MVDAIRERVTHDLHIEVRSAANGIEALQEINARAFDAIVCDLQMPGMDGVALLTELRSKQSEVPFVVVSGQGSVEVILKTLRLGAFDYIPKPLDGKQLVEVIGRAVDWGFRRRELTRKIESHLQKCPSLSEEGLKKIRAEERHLALLRLVNSTAR